MGQLAQLCREGEPVEPKYFPTPQFVQVEAPGTSLYLPVSQFVQDVAVSCVGKEKLNMKNIASRSLAHLQPR